MRCILYESFCSYMILSFKEENYYNESMNLLDYVKDLDDFT